MITNRFIDMVKERLEDALREERRNPSGYASLLSDCFYAIENLENAVGNNELTIMRITGAIEDFRREVDDIL